MNKNTFPRVLAGTALFFILIFGQAHFVFATTLSLSANPSAITQGSFSALSWSSSGAVSCSASGGWSGQKPISGYEQVRPAVTTTYTITCLNTNGQQTLQSVTVLVSQIQQQFPVASITATPSTVSKGQSVVLNWTSSNADFCYAILSWWGLKALSGSEAVTPINVTGSNIYRITCSNSFGSSSDEVLVAATQAQNPTVSLTASQTNVNAGFPVTLYWNAINANTCFATGGHLGAWAGSKTTSGSLAVYPLVTSTYDIVCTGPTGFQAQASVKISVIPAAVISPPSIQSFTAACVADFSVVRIGQRAEFFAGTSSRSRPFSYIWSGAANGTSESVSTSFTTAGVKTAYLTVTDATGKKAHTNCSVKVLAATFAAVSPVPKPTSYAPKPVSQLALPTLPAARQPSCAYYCVSQGQTYPQNPVVPEGTAIDTAKKSVDEKSVFAALFLTAEGAPRAGILFLFYLFLLSLFILVSVAIYLMIAHLRKPMP